MCLCTCPSYPACKSRVFCQNVVICGLFSLLNFSTLSHKRRDFWKKMFINPKFFSSFFLYEFWNISHCENNLANYYHAVTIRYSRQILMKIVFSQNIFENPIESSQLERHVYVWKFSNIVGTDSPSSGCYWWFDALFSGLYNSVQRGLRTECERIP